MGFDIVQGFLFAKPMPAREFGQSVLTRSVVPPRGQPFRVEELLNPDVESLSPS